MSIELRSTSSLNSFPSEVLKFASPSLLSRTASSFILNLKSFSFELDSRVPPLSLLSQSRIPNTVAHRIFGDGDVLTSRVGVFSSTPLSLLEKIEAILLLREGVLRLLSSWILLVVEVKADHLSNLIDRAYASPYSRISRFSLT